MRNLINLIPIVLVAICAACESMVTYIDIDNGKQEPRLAVSAVIDSDSGRFVLTFCDARPLNSTWRPDNETIVRGGEIRLFDNDSLIFSMENVGFNLSHEESIYGDGYRLEKTGFDFKVGHSYRLELEIDGYPMATATAVMPQAPVIENISVDKEHLVTKKKVKYVSHFGQSGGGSSWNSEYCPVNVTLSDNPAERDYYLIRQETVLKYDSPIQGLLPEYVFITDIGTPNMVLVQDNPDVENETSILDGEEVDLYMFERMLISDYSFGSASPTLNLLSAGTFTIDPKMQMPCENPTAHTKIYLLMSRISKFAFDHYRSLSLQFSGVGFFTEPVTIVANVENGYGAFIAISTVRTQIGNLDTCEGYLY